MVNCLNVSRLRTRTEYELVKHIAFIAFIPLTLAIFNTEWLYSPPGYIDPWVYLGYALNYTDPTFFDDYYKISRLPWILTLFTAHHILPPTVANHVSHLGIFVATLIPFYLALRILVGESGALIAALFLGVYLHAHGSAGWDYHNAIAGAFYAWAYYFFTIGWKRLPKQDSRALFISGVFVGLLIHTNVLFILFAPLMLLHFSALRGGVRRNELIQTMFLVLSGVTVVTTLLSIINWSVGRRLLFFKPLMDLLLSFASDPSQQKPWWHPWALSWLSGAEYLSFPIAIVCASVVALVVQVAVQNVRAQRIVLSLYCQLFLAVTIWVIGQTAGHTFLDWEYFAYPLIFPSSAALAAIAFVSKRETNEQMPIWFFLVFVIVLIAPLVVWSSVLQDIAMRSLGLLKLTIMPSIALFFVACLLLIIKSNRASLVAAVALLGFGNVSLAIVAINAGQPGSHISAADGNHSYSIAEHKCSTRRLVFDTVVELSSKLQEAAIPHSKGVLWHSSEEQLEAMPGCSPIAMKAHLAGPLYGLRYGTVRPPWISMPSISDIEKDQWEKWAAEKNILVVLAQDNRAIVEMRNRVGSFGIPSNVGSAGVINIGEARLRIDLLKLW
jgi:hypothetical protein